MNTSRTQRRHSRDCSCAELSAASEAASCAVSCAATDGCAFFSVEEEEPRPQTARPGGRLGPPGADVIRMKYFGQMTFEEIARLQDVSPNTAKTRFYRGLVKLRAMLEGDGLEGEGETP